MCGKTASKNESAFGKNTDDALLSALREMAFTFFTRKINSNISLVPDSTQPDSPSSIAAVGFALSCYPVAVERGLIERADALSRTLTVLRFFHDADQTGAADGVGYKGFFYHFLDMKTGHRAWKSELSIIDTTLLLAGMLVASQYFDGDATGEIEARGLTRAIYARIDWRWAQNGQQALVLGWTPESGFNADHWFGYNEAMLMYVLALAAPKFPIGIAAYAAWTSTFRWRQLYGHHVLYAGPLFIHQFSHIWLDLDGIQDRIMAENKSDYFENSRRATYIQQQYAIRNARAFEAYDAYCWGFTASNGPGNLIRHGKGRKRQFYGYAARGAPLGPDDGTISPWVAVASLPFAPEIVIPTIRHMRSRIGFHANGMGFLTSFNPTFDGENESPGWVSPWHYALNQGAIVLMIENYQTGLIWKLMRKCEPIRLGLLRCGFSGGWLGTMAGGASRAV